MFLLLQLIFSETKMAMELILYRSMLFKLTSRKPGLLNLNKIFESRFISSEVHKTDRDSKVSDQSGKVVQDIKQSKPQHGLRIAVIGVPNAGKSTFINSLINHRICATSSKVHTTRNVNKAVFTSDNVQLELFDTPGLVTEQEIKRHHLENSFIRASKFAVQNSDLIAVIHDISNSYTRNTLHSTVLHTLNSYQKKPSILVLNKIDALKSKRLLLDSIRHLTNGSIKSTKILQQYESSKKSKYLNQENTKNSGWSHFNDVFMVSSINGNGLTDVQKYFIHNAQPRTWNYSADCSTDELPENIIVNSVRARLLDYLPQEIPYKLHCELEHFTDSGTIYASVLVTCPSARIEKLICGVSNGKLYQITERVSSDLVETFMKPVSLTIATRTKTVIVPK